MLIDCGLFQGLKELRLRNWERLPFDPKQLDAVVLTHAHIDHVGYLPRFVKDGFRGPVYSTPATEALAELLLLDAAHNQEEDADYANRKGFSKHKPALPLFDVARREARDDAVSARCTASEWFSPAEPIWVRYHDTGHLLGSLHDRGRNPRRRQPAADPVLRRRGALRRAAVFRSRSRRRRATI